MVSRETRLQDYARLLTEANKDTNLVSRRLSPNEILEMVESFAGTLEAAECAAPQTLLDIGTGGGLPGIPLAIAHPRTDVVLIEPRKRRVEHIRVFLKELSLTNVTLFAGRAEQLSGTLGQFDAVTAFGVGPPLEMMDLVEPFLAPAGAAILSCPGDITREQWAAWLLRAAVLDMTPTHRRGALAGTRSILVLRHRPLEPADPTGAL